MSMLVAFATLSLLLGLVIIHSDLEGEPSWARKNSGGTTVLMSTILKRTGSVLTNRIPSNKKGERIKEANSNTQKITTPVSTRFFPTRGTDAFFQQCNWTFDRASTTNKNCTFLARPNLKSNEKISDWISQIVSGHLMALQKGCRLLLDYGESVNVSQVLTPFPVMAEHPMTNQSTGPFHHTLNALKTYNRLLAFGRKMTIELEPTLIMS